MEQIRLSTEEALIQDAKAALDVIYDLGLSVCEAHEQGLISVEELERYVEVMHTTPDRVFGEGWEKEEL